MINLWFEKKTAYDSWLGYPPLPPTPTTTILRPLIRISSGGSRGGPREAMPPFRSLKYIRPEWPFFYTIICTPTPHHLRWRSVLLSKILSWLEKTNGKRKNSHIPWVLAKVHHLWTNTAWRCRNTGKVQKLKKKMARFSVFLTRNP